MPFELLSRELIFARMISRAFTSSRSSFIAARTKSFRGPISIIAIAPCGPSLCGKVAWASARGRREVAKNTSNVVGTTVLSDLVFSGGRWSGLLYIPDDDIHVSAKLQSLSPKQLKLTGCVMMGLLCRTQVWTRIDSLPPRDG